jgi:hypothetical protein
LGVTRELPPEWHEGDHLGVLITSQHVEHNWGIRDSCSMRFARKSIARETCDPASSGLYPGVQASPTGRPCCSKKPKSHAQHDLDGFGSPAGKLATTSGAISSGVPPQPLAAQSGCQFTNSVKVFSSKVMPSLASTVNV